MLQHLPVIENRERRSPDTEVTSETHQTALLALDGVERDCIVGLHAATWLYCATAQHVEYTGVTVTQSWNQCVHEHPHIA